MVLEMDMEHKTVIMAFIIKEIKDMIKKEGTGSEQ